MRNKPYTNIELFNEINKRLQGKGILPDILDYGVPDTREYPIKSCEWDLIGIVNFGGCEGIYLHLYCRGETGNDNDRIPVGVYKTLQDDIDAFKAMGDLNAEFVFETRSLVNKNMDDFTWMGYDIYEQDTEGCIIPRYEVRDWKRALSVADEMAKDRRHPVNRILLRENSTRIVTAYDVKGECLVPLGKIDVKIA